MFILALRDAFFQVTDIPQVKRKSYGILTGYVVRYIINV